MNEISMTDRKILYQLDINARQSHAQIGRNIGLHKNAVRYRINNLIKKGVITNFYTLIDSFKLGYISLRFLITFQYASEQKREEIICYFSKQNNIWYIAELEGKYDLVLNMWVKNLSTFSQFWDVTLKKYRDYFTSQHLSIYVQTNHYLESHLLQKDFNKKDRLKYEIINKKEDASFDHMDLLILQSISINARRPIVKIAEQLDTTSSIVQYRMKKMMKQKIIQAFRVNIDISKLGLSYYTLNFELCDYSKRKNIIDFVKLNPLVKMIDKSIGGPDLIIGIRTENMHNAQNFIKTINTTFSDAIISYDYFYFLKLKKLNFFPMTQTK